MKHIPARGLITRRLSQQLLNSILFEFHSPAVNQDWPLYQLNVKNVFMDGDLEEEVYMTIPPRSKNNPNNRLVCKLKYSYGLNQLARAWCDRFCERRGFPNG